MEAAGISAGSRCQLHYRLRGGGGDGGATGAESRVSYLEMYMGKKPDKVRPVGQPQLLASPIFLLACSKYCRWRC